MELQTCIMVLLGILTFEWLLVILAIIQLGRGITEGARFRVSQLMYRTHKRKAQVLRLVPRRK